MKHWLALYSKAMTYYDQPHRHYHNAMHIHSLFAEADRLNIQLSESQTIAILFHDLVYVPGLPYGTNELASAKMVDVLITREMGVSDSTIAKAKSIILDTIDHEPTSIESAFVLDLDLHELGTNQYVKNSKEVRKEFEFVDMETYLRGRITFLEKYLAKVDLFHTIVFHDLYENKARDNMSKELAQLKAKYNVV